MLEAALAHGYRVGFSDDGDGLLISLSNWEVSRSYRLSYEEIAQAKVDVVGLTLSYLVQDTVDPYVWSGRPNVAVFTEPLDIELLKKTLADGWVLTALSRRAYPIVEWDLSASLMDKNGIRHLASWFIRVPVKDDRLTLYEAINKGLAVPVNTELLTCAILGCDFEASGRCVSCKTTARTLIDHLQNGEVRKVKTLQYATFPGKHIIDITKIGEVFP